MNKGIEKHMKNIIPTCISVLFAIFVGCPSEERSEYMDGGTDNHNGEENDEILDENRSQHRFVSAGSIMSCMLDTDGIVSCWGNNDFGSGKPSTPVSGRFRVIKSSWYQTCGIMEDNSVSCWGSNQDGITLFKKYRSISNSDCGILEDGTLDCGDSQDKSGKYVKISKDGSGICAIKENGSLECWGSDFALVDIPDGEFIDVDVGSNFACAISEANKLSCFGNELYDEVSGVPEGDFTQVEANFLHACAVRVDGNIACWGDNEVGQSEDMEGNFLQVSAGYEHNCAVKENGEVICWGDNRYGKASPPQSEWQKIAVDSIFVCGIKNTGEISCVSGRFEGTRYELEGTYESLSLHGGNLCTVDESSNFTCRNVATHEALFDAQTGVDKGCAMPGYGCALKDDGTIDCFGGEPSGGLADLEGRSDLIDIGCDEYRVCGLTAVGDVICVGRFLEDFRTSNIEGGQKLVMKDGTYCVLNNENQPTCRGGMRRTLGVPEGEYTLHHVAGGRWCGLQGTTMRCQFGYNQEQQSVLSDVIHFDFSKQTICAVRLDGRLSCWGYIARGVTEADFE